MLKDFEAIIFPTRSLEFLRPLHNAENGYRPPATPTPVEAGTNVSNGDGSFAKLSSDPPIKLHVLVVGAGIGGLVTGIALARNGHRVTIVEQSKQLNEV